VRQAKGVAAGLTDFIHLHLHSEYSLLDGAARIEAVTVEAARLGMPALAITDHGSMYGVVDFYKACREAGIKPILGCEFYVAPRGRGDRTPKVDDNPFHLVLLAENQEGYQNLLRLASLSFTEGFYYKPRVDREALKSHHRGLIALSGCLGGEVAANLLAGNMERAREAAAFYRDLFGPDNYYLELQDHGMPDQQKVNPLLASVGAELGIPLVASNDIHYVKREHAEIQDVLLCIQTGKTVNDTSRMKFKSDQLYLKSAADMAAVLGRWPEALANTVRIAERCRVEISFDQMHLPDFAVPQGHTPQSYLRELCAEGVRRRYGPDPSPEVRERLEFELSVIEKMGFSAYFLIVWDFINHARSQGIPVGPGRGSAAGSLVAYSLGITSLDPLAYGLLFERFLNPGRISMPDIDTDICFERRPEVIDYVVRRYGADRVAQIITFGTMAARAAIRDVGRVLSMPYGDVDKVAKLVPAELHMTIAKALEISPELKEAYEEKPEIKKLIDTAAGLEGMPRHASTHAAGIVITKKPLTEYLPLYRSTDGTVTTQFAMTTVEELGLLKMDLLGLRTLTVIGETVRMIKESGGPDIDLDRLPLDDRATYEMLGRGETTAVFQFESSGMRNILRDLKPNVFEDIVALVALYRPGPLGSGMVEDFVKGKHGKKKVTYLHPLLEPILRETYGVILYQEQVMQIAGRMAGFSMAEADTLRKAMGKKKPEVMAKFRAQFVNGAMQNGVDEAVATEVFNLMEYFAGYGFNKSHSAAYALVSYQTAYLKANYPAHYMAAHLTSVRDNSDKVAVDVEECRRMKLEVLPPDVNESRESFTVVGDKLRFGLAAVKNVGLAAVNEMLEIRQKGGPFRSLADFCQRVGTKVVNRRVVESLIKSGAFDSFGHRRAALMEGIDAALALAGRAQRERASGQITLFDFFTDVPRVELTLPEVEEYDRETLLRLEKETLGLYISGHPLDSYRHELEQPGLTRVADLGEAGGNGPVSVAGMISGIRARTSKSGQLYATCTLEDLTGSVPVVFYPSAYQEYRALLTEDAVVVVKGKPGSDDEVKLTADSVAPLVRLHQTDLRLTVDGLTVDQLANLQLVLKQHPGPRSVYLYLAAANRLYRAGDDLRVNVTDALLHELRCLLGETMVEEWAASPEPEPPPSPRPARPTPAAEAPDEGGPPEAARELPYRCLLDL